MAKLCMHASTSSGGACLQIYEDAEDASLFPGLVEALSRQASRQASGHASESPKKERLGSGALGAVSAPGVTCAAFVGAVANCSNCIIGAGTLAVPKTVGMSGIVSYHILVAVILFFTFVSLRWLVEVTDALPPGMGRNYEGVANHYLGARWNAAISLAFFGGGLALTMAYIILITTSLTPVLVGLGFGSESTMEPLVRFGLGLGVCLPLTMLRDISRLRFTSTLAICAMTFATCFITHEGYEHVAMAGPSESVELVHLSPEIFGAIAMSVSAYSCHIAVMPIYESLGPGRTPRIMMKIITSSLVISFLLYEAVGLAGYLQFGAGVQGNVLASLARGRTPSIGMILATVSVSLSLIFSVPIIVWPLRSCILSSYQMYVGSSDREPTDTQWRVTTALVMAAVLAAATIFPDVKTALSVVGSLGGAFIVFIYPAAFNLAVVKEVPPSDWRLRTHARHLFMMAMGVLVGVLCLTFSLKSAFGL